MGAVSLSGGGIDAGQLDGLKHIDRLSHRGAVWTATKSQRSPERGFGDDFSLFGIGGAGHDCGCASRRGRTALLALVYPESDDLLRRTDVLPTANHTLVPPAV